MNLHNFLIVTDDEGKYLRAMLNEDVFRSSLDMTYSRCKEVHVHEDRDHFPVVVWTITYKAPTTRGLESRQDIYRTAEHAVEILTEPEHF